MRSILTILFVIIAMIKADNSAASEATMALDTVPAFTGKFTDDYGIGYHITDSVWTQLPKAKYHVLEWNRAEQYILARNDDNNPSEKGLYTRIDYLVLPGMAPWTWAFCLTTYNAISAEVALKAAAADRLNPRKGCNGFPFSRMKKAEHD